MCVAEKPRDPYREQVSAQNRSGVWRRHLRPGIRSEVTAGELYSAYTSHVIVDILNANNKTNLQSSCT